MKRRRGYTLLETVAVVALLGAFLGLAGTTLATLWRLDESARRELAIASSTLSWELQLRDDVHRTTEVWLDGAMLKARPDATHTAEWFHRDGFLIRQWWEADTLVTEDRWPLANHHTAHWRLEDGWLHVWLASEERSTQQAEPSSGDRPTEQGMEINIEIGRFQRWMRAGRSTP